MRFVAAAVLGAMALLVVVYNIMNLYPSRKPAVTVTTASPTPAASSRQNLETVSMPSKEAENMEYTLMELLLSPACIFTS